jgi:DNA-binding SARP family transcriptional activator
MATELTDSLVARQTREGVPILHLFGGPSVTCGRRRIDVPQGSKRLLVFVALHRGQVERAHAAGTLWPVGSENRAAGNLRSALWRLSRAELPLLTADKCYLALDRNLLVDAHLVGEWAGRVIAGRASTADLACVPTGADAVDLLPGWYEDWALLERERLRQRMLHALEALSRQLVRLGRFAEGVEAAVAAVAADPLRESAQRALIEAHLAEGNWSEGRRQFEAYRETLRNELDIEPDQELAALVRRAKEQPRHPQQPRPAARLRGRPGVWDAVAGLPLVGEH